MDVFLEHRPEYALELRHAPPSHAWLNACRRCRGPEILFAFFDDVRPESTPDSAALASLLRRFETRGSQRMSRGGRDLIVVDGPMPPLPTWPGEAAFIYLDRRRIAKLPRGAFFKHVVCEHSPVIERSFDGVLESAWLPKATVVDRITFINCSHLVNVSLPVVARVGDSAFAACRSLRSVSLGARDIRQAVFAHCSQLERVSLPFASIAPPNLFLGCSAMTSVSMPVATHVFPGAFLLCSSLTVLELPAVRRLERAAFDNCPNLETVSLLSLVSAHKDAFQRCQLLVKANIAAPDTVKTKLRLL